MSEENLICSFCSNSRKDTKKLIVGAQKVAICNECVALCNEVLDEDIKKIAKEKIKDGKKNLLNPVHIKDHLDHYVIGQDDAKTVLSVAVANHYKRIMMPPPDFDIEKSNVLLIGATGSGKTLMAKTIAKYLDVPFAIADATTLTESGYVGDDVENVVGKLYNAAKGDKHLCERGIIFVDEIDKICKKSDSPSITRDVSGEGVQQGLLKIVEGTTCRVPPHGGRKHPDQAMIEIDTTNILFIVGGAFVDLQRQIKKRKHSGIGFGSTINNNDDDIDLSSIEPEDLIKFGMIPEFVGRFSMITHVNNLTELQLVKIMTEPKDNIIKQIKYLFGLDNISIDFTKGAKLAIAKKAKKLGTNARGLKNIIEKIILPYQFEATEMRNKGVEKIQITEEVVEKNVDPILTFSENYSKTNNNGAI